MSVVFVIGKFTSGPCGHGSPGEPYFSMMHDGGYKLGVLAPVFQSREDAEEYRKEHDQFNWYSVVSVRLK